MLDGHSATSGSMTLGTRQHTGAMNHKILHSRIREPHVAIWLCAGLISTIL